MEITTPVGHKTLRLTDVDPKRSASFSPNLHKYLRSSAHFYTDGGLAEGMFIVRPGSRASHAYVAGTLMLGYQDDGYLIGTRVMDALCNGAKAQRAAHPIGNSCDLIEGFWDRYLQVGRCAIDPSHQESFMSERFLEKAEERECRWCGHRQRKVITPRTVYDEYWVALQST